MILVPIPRKTPSLSKDQTASACHSLRPVSSYAVHMQRNPLAPQHDALDWPLTHKGGFPCTPSHLKQVLYHLTYHLTSPIERTRQA